MRPVKLIVDGPNLAHRCRHAYNLATTKGRPTGVLYGCLTSLALWIERFDPDEVIFIWETPHESWRYEVYPEYKSARHKRILDLSTEDFQEFDIFRMIQMNDVKKALKGMGIRQLAVPKLEADDVLGLLAMERKEDNSKYVVISTDQDMLQLVRRDRCKVYSPLKDIVYHEDRVGRLVGKGEVVAPSPYTYLAWRTAIGDVSDSIPGVKGIGEKTIHKALGTARWNGESISTYFYSGSFSEKQKQKISHNRVLLKRNLSLMALGKEAFLPKLEPHYGGETAQEFMHICTVQGRSWREGDTHLAYPTFLRSEKYPSPMLIFFRKREFSFAFDPIQWKEWIRAYRRLYRRTQATNKKNWNIPEGKWDI